MKGIIFCLLVMVAISAAEPAVECTETYYGYIDHTVYCNKFYSCVYGWLRELTCAAGYKWNSVKQNCDYPENVDCGNLIMPTKSMKDDNVELLPSVPELPEFPVLSSNESVESGENIEDQPNIPDRPHPPILPHPPVMPYPPIFPHPPIPAHAQAPKFPVPDIF